MDKKIEQSKRHQFDAYCKKVLRNEARDIYDSRKRQQRKEVLFSEMSPYELGKLSFTPEYFRFERLVHIGGVDFIVNDEGIFEALGMLSNRRREIILLSYFMGLTDREIGEVVGMERANVQYHRKQALKELGNVLDEMEDSL